MTAVQPDFGSDVNTYSAFSFTPTFGHVDVKVCTDFEIMTNAVNEITQQDLHYFRRYYSPPPKTDHVRIFLNCIQNDHHVRKFKSFEELEEYCVQNPHCVLLNCQLCSVLYRRKKHDVYQPAADQIAIDMFNFFVPILTIDTKRFMHAEEFKIHCFQPMLLFRNNGFRNIMQRIMVQDSKHGDTYFVEPHETRSTLTDISFNHRLREIHSRKNDFKIMWLWHSAYNWYYKTLAEIQYHPHQLNSEIYRSESMLLLTSHRLLTFMQ